VGLGGQLCIAGFFGPLGLRSNVIEPFVYLAYAPRGAGALCACLNFAVDEQVYGWYTGSRAAEVAAEFFMLENFYSPKQTVFYRSGESDVYGTWLVRKRDVARLLDRPPPVPQEICHELNRLQSSFVQEWVFYAEDENAAEEAAAYQALGLPVQPVNIKSRRLGKFDKSDAIWTYASTGQDMNVIGFLMRHWPLDHDAPESDAGHRLTTD
jgi:hypothetical protein